MPPAKKPASGPATTKQTTLFKHIAGVPPPPKEQQPKLEALWGQKKAAEGSSKEAKADGDAMTVDEALDAAPVASSSTVKPADGGSSPAKKKARTDATSSPAKSSPSKPKASSPSASSAVKDEATSSEEDAPVTAGKRKRAKAVVLSDAEDASEGESTTKAKGKGKAKAADPALQLRKKSASPRKQSSSPARGLVDSEEGSGESEMELSEEDAPVTKKGSKAAASALEKIARLTDSTASTSKEYPVWGPKDPVPYAALAHCFSKIESTTKRLLIKEYLTNFLVLVVARAAPAMPEGQAEEVLKKGKNAAQAAGGGKGETGADSLLKVIYLCINRLCPEYEGLELGVGDSIIMKAIAESTGRSAAQVKSDLAKHGDLGLVAQLSKTKQGTLFQPKPLSVPQVFAKFTEMAKLSGSSSQARKIGIINGLLAASRGEEAKYLVRAFTGKMRLGLAQGSVIPALAHASVIVANQDKKLPSEVLQQKLIEGEEIVKAVYSELPNLNLIIPSLLQYGVEGLRDHCKLTPGVPLKPMLAKPTKAITEVLDRFEGKHFTCEYKYDGERAQIHREADGTLTVYSRNSENMSQKYPDLVEQLPRAIKEGANSFVIDCEAVAWDKVKRKLLPFQEITKRKRKDVKAEDVTVKVHLFAFDILYLNGESLLQKELHERRKILFDNFTPVEGEFAFAKSSDGDSTEEIQQFLEDSVKDSCEGLMIKMLNTAASTYEPSKRSINWLKLKKDYLEGVGDSLDLVVVGAYHGQGKRASVYGAFLLACYDEDSEQYQTVCKIGTGFSDEMLAESHATLKALEMGKARSDIQVGGAKPDVWFEPKVVWEVLVADLSLSPIYAAAKGIVDERGISLRFPRFIRVRDDKDAEQATTSDQIAEFYQNQAVVSSNTKGGGDDFW